MAGSFFVRLFPDLPPDTARQRILAYLILFLIFFSTLDSENTGSLRPFVVLSFASLLLFVLHAVETERSAEPLLRRHGITLTFLCLLAWCALSLLYTIDRAASEYGLIKLFNAAVLLAVLPVAFPQREKQMVFWKAAVLWASVLSLAGLAQFFLPIGRYESRAHSLFVTPNTLAGYLLIPLPLAFALWLRARQNPGKNLWAACALLISSAFIASGSRGAWLAFVAAGIVWAAVLIRSGRFRLPTAVAAPRRRRWAWLLVVLVCASIVLIQAGRSRQIAERFRSLSHVLTAEPDRYRYWASTLDIIRTRPWTGYGLRTFIFVYPGHQARELAKTFQIYAHNDYLQMAAETGLIGFGLFIFLAAGIAIRGWRSLRAGEGQLAAALTMGIWAVLLHSLVDFDFHIPAIQTLFWLGVAYLLTAEGAAAPPAEAFISRPPRRMRRVAVVLLAVGIGGTLARHYLGELTTVRGYRLLQKKDFDGARRWFARAETVVPYNSFHLANLARASHAEGEEKKEIRLLLEAEGYLHRALALNPFDFDARILLARIYSRNLDLFGEQVRPRLTAVLEEGIVLFPKADVFRRQLGRVLIEGGEYARAVDPLERYLSWWPNDDQARLWLAAALSGSGQVEESRREALRVLGHDPENQEARLLLGKPEAPPLQ